MAHDKKVPSNKSRRVINFKLHENNNKSISETNNASLYVFRAAILQKFFR